MPSTKSMAAMLLSAMTLAPALANPIAAPMPTAAPSPVEVESAFVERNIEKRAATCTFSGSLGYSSASKSKASCSTIILKELTVPGGVTLDMTDLPDDTTVIFQGETSFTFKEWEGPLFAVSGNNIKVAGSNAYTAILNGNGASYWDGEGGSGGKTKPNINSVSNLELAYITVDASAGDALAKNTDAFDIGSSDQVIIEYATVYNQDDCVAINSGSHITFKNGYCSGGHGLSIGSVGGRSNNTVDTVSFLDSTVTKSVQAIRIKTIAGDTGLVNNVEYDGITMSSISKYGILIEQNYNGGDLHGDPGTGVPITDLTIKNIVGTGAVASSGYDVVVVCGSTSCKSWTWSSVAVTCGKKYASCQNVPTVVGACS
ncbi:hypothetical protein BOTNAR_0527g00050 [Botryotinia narcissicola]|uniref:Endo-polygalacturonase n=1 Tax=Botryotinia narcissicola TaxID=278944 RepID=A0A4Z1HKV0_9HELO|nr:hypothetical protein BOTNAR_0527g00050 [Botryotinia narcissicola]